MTEEWRQIAGYEGYYEVSNHGRVRSLDRVIARKGKGSCLYRGRVISPGDSGWNLQVGLSKGHRRWFPLVHRLVLEAFVGPCPEGMECCHNDGDYRNNHLTNIRWDTHVNNMRDSIQHGTHYSSSRTHCPRGHLYDSGNTSLGENGARQCRACHNERARQKYRRAVEARMKRTQELLSAGHSDQEIAADLDVCLRTIQTYKKRLQCKNENVA